MEELEREGKGRAEIMKVFNLRSVGPKHLPLHLRATVCAVSRYRKLTVDQWGFQPAHVQGITRTREFKYSCIC